MHDAAGPGPHMFEPDGHGEAGRNLQADLGKAGRRAIDVAVIHQVANLQHEVSAVKVIAAESTLRDARSSPRLRRIMPPTQNDNAGTP